MGRTTWALRPGQAEITMKAWYIVSYDVRDDRRLKQVARKLCGFGTRLQYSIFRCRLSERDLERLRWELTQVLTEDDSLLIVSLCDHCIEKLKARNPNTHWPKPEDTFLVL